jgi:hypothetical protein
LIAAVPRAGRSVWSVRGSGLGPQGREGAAKRPGELGIMSVESPNRFIAGRPGRVAPAEEGIPF